MKRVVYLIVVLLLVIGAVFVGRASNKPVNTESRNVVREESVVIEVAERVSPSVVTVSIKTPKQNFLQFSPFGGLSEGTRGGEKQDIGSGFVVSADGMIVTNKHVVSGAGTYQVITSDDREYEVKSISRDPNNDIAVLKIDPSAGSGLKPVVLGNSDTLKVGQFVVAIGTALGEFRHTVTTGVVSGLGRGITAGSAFEGYVEKLDNVIQTDAAINPGNSGGPLLNSKGEVIGINVAVASGAENIGFALPVNLVKKALESYNQTGSFPNKAFLGVRYQVVSKKTAIANEVVAGMYVVSVVEESPAAEAGILVDDIITKIDGMEVGEEADLAEIIAKKKPGDKVKIDFWRNGATKSVTATLSEVEG
jgi:serine protease Do